MTGRSDRGTRNKPNGCKIAWARKIRTYWRQASGEPPPVQDIMALLEKLGDLKAKGILSEEEFAAKKTELLKKL